MFNFIGGQPICENCKKALEDDFQKVKQYIVDNPRASLKEIADDNGVTTKQLQQWIREERLMFTSDSPIQLQCENCGELIQTGRFCAKCKATMANNLTDTFAKPKPVLQQPVKKEQKAVFFPESPTTEHTLASRTRPSRIGYGKNRIICGPIRTPLPNIPMHIVNAPGIGFL